jgi:hypothetical protein
MKDDEDFIPYDEELGTGYKLASCCGFIGLVEAVRWVRGPPNPCRFPEPFNRF